MLDGLAVLSLLWSQHSCKNRGMESGAEGIRSTVRSRYVSSACASTLVSQWLVIWWLYWWRVVYPHGFFFHGQLPIYSVGRGTVQTDVGSQDATVPPTGSTRQVLSGHIAPWAGNKKPFCPASTAAVLTKYYFSPLLILYRLHL